MFSRFAVALISIATLATGVSSAPVALKEQSLARRTPVSFSHWHGISSLDGFDNFYGVDNFSGFVSEQTVVEQTVVEHHQELVCHSQSIEIIQQRLVVLQEMAKRIITEQICEVETQTIVFQQFLASSSHFSTDLTHVSGHHIGYDSAIVSHYGDLVDSDGSLSTHDLGFSGHDVGKNTVVVGGSNWNSQTSPASVNSAVQAAQNASTDDSTSGSTESASVTDTSSSDSAAAITATAASTQAVSASTAASTAAASSASGFSSSENPNPAND